MQQLKAPGSGITNKTWTFGNRPQGVVASAGVKLRKGRGFRRSKPPPVISMAAVWGGRLPLAAGNLLFLYVYSFLCVFHFCSGETQTDDTRGSINDRKIQNPKRESAVFLTACRKEAEAGSPASRTVCIFTATTLLLLLCILLTTLVLLAGPYHLRPRAQPDPSARPRAAAGDVPTINVILAAHTKRLTYTLILPIGWRQGGRSLWIKGGGYLKP